MDNSKLSQRLRLLSQREFRQFGQLVHSPYFTGHRDTVVLFELMEPHYPEFALTDEWLAEQLNPLDPPDSPRLRVLRSYLLDLLDQFFIQQEIKEDKIQQTACLARQLAKRGMQEDAEQSLEAGIKLLEEGNHQSHHPAQNRLLLELERVNIRLQRENRSPDLDLDHLLHLLDTFYLANRLKYLCTYVSQGFHLTVALPTTAIAETLASTAQPLAKKQPVIALYRHLLQLLLQEPHTQHYPALTQLMAQHQDQLPITEWVNICGFLQNHLNQRYQRGHADALHELLELYQQMLKMDLVFSRGEFSAHLFRNIAVVGARLGQFNWTREFILQNHMRLAPNQRETLYHYGLAYLHFTEQDYAIALRHLQQIQFIDPFYRTGHQILLLRIYYETAEEEAFLSLSHTFRRFLNRSQSISAPHKEASLNFLSIGRKLLKAKMGLELSTKEVAKIRQEIDTCQYLTDKTWLLSKIEELSAKTP